MKFNLELQKIKEVNHVSGTEGCTLRIITTDVNVDARENDILSISYIHGSKPLELVVDKEANGVKVKGTDIGIVWYELDSLICSPDYTFSKSYIDVIPGENTCYKMTMELSSFIGIVYEDDNISESDIPTHIIHYNEKGNVAIIELSDNSVPVLELTHNGESVWEVLLHDSGIVTIRSTANGMYSKSYPSYINDDIMSLISTLVLTTKERKTVNI